VTIAPRLDGLFAVTRQGHLRLPAAARHRCGLHAGDRVLLVADPARQRLVIFPPAMLDTLLAPSMAEALCGDAA
jgi:hypothetical protein